MKKLCILLFVILLVGCGAKNELTIEKIEADKTPKEIQFFVEDTQSENGVYMYMSGSELEQYILLTGIQEPFAAFSNVSVEIENDALRIHFTEDETTEVSSSNQQLWKVTVPKKMDRIQIFRNGEETNIDGVY